MKGGGKGRATILDGRATIIVGQPLWSVGIVQDYQNKMVKFVSSDYDTGLYLAVGGQVTSVMASDWLSDVKWQNTGLWLALGDQVARILITYAVVPSLDPLEGSLEYRPLIGWFMQSKRWSRAITSLF